MNTTVSKLNREQLEKEALATVSSELYFDLLNAIDDAPDAELERIIACNGDYEKEIAETPAPLADVVNDLFRPLMETVEKARKMIFCEHDMETLDALRSRCRKDCGLLVNIQDIVAHGHYECNLDVTEETQRELGRGYAWCQDHNEAFRLTWWEPAA